MIKAFDCVLFRVQLGIDVKRMLCYGFTIACNDDFVTVKSAYKSSGTQQKLGTPYSLEDFLE